MPKYEKLSAHTEQAIKLAKETGVYNDVSCKDSMVVRRRNLDKDTATIWRPTFVHDIDKILHCPFYNRYTDKTQVFSFYKNDEVKASEENKDFYSLISEIDDNLMEFYQPELCGKLITDYTISDFVLNAFREYVIEYEKYEWNGHDPIDIYPLELNYSDKYQDVLEKLGITPTIDYIDMNGTCFILYEDEDERIEFYIEKWMPIYDPPADRFGNNMCIIYYQNGKMFELI